MSLTNPEGARWSMGDVTQTVNALVAQNPAGVPIGTTMASGSEDVLVIGASAEARCNPITAIVGSSLSIKNGIVSFLLQFNYPLHNGRFIHVACKPFPAADCMAIVLSQGTVQGLQSITAQIIGPRKDDLALGTVSGNSIDMHDMHCWSAACGWPSMLQTMLGGRIRCIMQATGGTNLSDWNTPIRQQQIASYGRVGAIILAGGGVGNSLNAQGQSAKQTWSDYQTLIKFCQPYARVVYCFVPPTVSSQNSSNIQAGSPVLAAGMVLTSYMDDIPRLFPFARNVPMAGAECQNWGPTTTADITNGWALYTNKYDDGIHNLWGEAQIWAASQALIMKNDLPYRSCSMQIAPNSVLNSSAADVGGQFIQNMFEGFFGTVAQTGNAPNSCSASTAGLNGFTTSSAVIVNGNGGSDWVVTINSNGNNAISGTTFNMFYNGTTNSLKTQLNLARNQGVPIDIWVDCGIYGFGDLTMQYIEVVLETDNGDGQGIITEAAGYANQGSFLANSAVYQDTTRGAMPSGFNGMVRFPRFTIPTGTVYQTARIRVTSKPRTNFNPGIYTMRMGGDCVIKALTVS